MKVLALEQLIQVRSQLAEEVLAYMDGLAEHSAKLPKYYPERLRAVEAGKTPFDDVRQIVQVVEDRTAFERWLAEERERMRAAGQDFDRIAYNPKRSLMEEEESDERGYERRDRPAPPPPFQWDENAGSRFKRAVILGDPGFGKTWLLRYEARRLARAAAKQLRNCLRDLDQITLPIFVRLSELNRSDNPIEDALVETVSAGRSAAFRQLVREKLATERCVILLDAWDEVPIEVPPKTQPIAFEREHRQRLGQRLDAFARQFTQPRILMTSRIVGYDQSPIPDLPGQEKVKELELLAFNTPQIEAFVRVWFGEGDTANQFLAMLRQNHQIRGLARIPLMLTLLCRIWTESKEKKQGFPTRRVELYDRCLRGLLSDWKIDDKGHDKEEVSVTLAYVDAMIDLLQEVGYELFVEGYEQFSPSLLRAKIMQCLAQFKAEHELYGSNAAELIAGLKRDGLLITVGEHHDAPLLFLHRTFQEYLAASALAEQAEDEGWQAIEVIVSKKAWLPEWQQTIILLAGKLDNPAQILEMLANPAPSKFNSNGDDLFRHRLALAARCLPEIDHTYRKSHSVIIDRITTSTFCLLWDHYRNKTDYATPYLKSALPALMQVNGCVAGRIFSDQSEGVIEKNLKLSLSNLVLRLLRSRGLSDDAVGVIRAMGAAAVTPDIINALAALLRDPRQYVRHTAVEAIGAMGAAATSDIINALATPLRDPDQYVRDAAVRAIIEMGAAAATPDFLSTLVALLHDPDHDVRDDVVRAISGMGAAAATPDIINALAALLHDRDNNMVHATVRATEAMGAAAATPGFISPFAAVLGYPGHNVRVNAVRAIGKIGAAAATPDIINALAALLHDRDNNMRHAAVRAIGAVGVAAATPDIINALTALLHDRDREVRAAVVGAIRSIGAAVATPDIINALATLLRGSDRYERDAAVKAIGAMGAMGAKATSDIINALAALLRDPDQYVRADAVRAVGVMGAKATNPDFLNALAALLRDQHLDMGVAAVEAVRATGAAATPNFLNAFAALLRSRYSDVRIAAVRTINAMGAAAITPDIINALPALLHEPEHYERVTAAIEIGVMSASMPPPDIINVLTPLLRDPRQYVRAAAVRAIGMMGAVAATPDFLSVLADLLRTPNKSVRSDALSAIIAMGAAAATPNIINALALLLRDPRHDIGAARAVGAMGAAAATPDIVNALTILLRSLDQYVRAIAVEAVGGMGVVAVIPDFLSALAVLLRDPDRYKRDAAVRAIRAAGVAAATPNTINALAALLRDPDRYVRRDVVKAIGAIGIAAATPDFLNALATVLRAPDRYVKESAVRAFGAMGASAIPPNMINAVVLRERNWETKLAAMEVIKEMGTVGATPNIVNALTSLLHDQNPNVKDGATRLVRRLYEMDIRIFEKPGVMRKKFKMISLAELSQ